MPHDNDDDNILVAGGLHDPGNEVHSKAEYVSLRMDKINLLLMFYRIEPAHMSGWYQKNIPVPICTNVYALSNLF